MVSERCKSIYKRSDTLPQLQQDEPGSLPLDKREKHQTLSGLRDGDQIQIPAVQ